MGLQTTNYEVKKLGITLDTAYAIVSKLSVDGTHGQAEFHIQADREKAFTLEPIEKVNITFEVERDKNPLEQAYEASKAVRTVKEWDFNTHTWRTKEIQKPFYGWEDDIIEPVVEEVEETPTDEPIINFMSEDETGGEEEIIYE